MKRLALLAAVFACGEPSAPLAPPPVAAMASQSVNSILPNAGLVGRLTSIGGLLQVQDARLDAVAAGWTDPPDPNRQLTLVLGAIRAAAMSLAERAADLERISGGSLPPSPIQPPDPGFPPDPCHPPDPGLPPGPCRVGLLRSMGNALAGADSRLASIQAGFQAPDSPDKPAVLTALATIKAAAMSLAETAEEMLNAIGE